MRPNIKLAFLGFPLLIALTACNLAVKTPDAAATLQAIYTVQALTLQALQTQAASTPTPAPLPTMAFPTLSPLNTPTSTRASLSTLTPISTLPPIQTPIPISYCDWAAFVKDVTVPDGTIIPAGGAFTKTWRIKNVGSCAWNANYALVFARGDSLKGLATVNLTGDVYPGQTVDLSIKLTAPTENGRYVGYWLLRNSAGVLFGSGGEARSAFYVDVVVGGDLTPVYSFASSYCSADWRSDAGDLGCPGNVSGKKGYVIKVNKAQLEDGEQTTVAGILMSPQKVNNGYLQGYFPAFTVRSGDQFTSIVNCEYQATNCDVVFRLDYKIGNEAVKTYWEYREIYDGDYYHVNLDLTPFAGKKVSFILTVLANGSPDDDRAIWVNPLIKRIAGLTTITPTPTRTSTITPTRRPRKTVTPTPTRTRKPRPTRTPTPTP